jgi:hypothetical protein
VVKVAKKAYEKVRNSPDAALNFISLATSEGRKLAFRRIDANTRSVEAKAANDEAIARKTQAEAVQSEAIGAREWELAAQEKIKTAKTYVEAVKDMDHVIDKMKDPELKKRTRQRLKSEIAGLKGSKDVPALPPPPA